MKPLLNTDELKQSLIKLNGKPRLINKLAFHNICVLTEPWLSCRQLTRKETSLFFGCWPVASLVGLVHR